MTPEKIIRRNANMLAGKSIQKTGSPELVDQGISKEPQRVDPVISLFEGAAGSGRRAFAERLHALSERKDLAFRVYNCGRCSPLEARRVFLGELHGGAPNLLSSGRQQLKTKSSRYLKYLGLLEESAEGTLFLDEIDQLSFDMQVILARVLREQQFFPIGSDAPIRFNGKLMVATTLGFDALVKAELLHSDFLNLVSPQEHSSET